jgi:hypothetical protein
MKGLWICTVAVSLLATAAQAQERQTLRTHMAATAGTGNGTPAVVSTCNGASDETWSVH